MPDPTTASPAAAAPPSADELRLVLFGMPAAGKSSLLGALARAAESQEHVLGGKLVDPTHGLDELEKQVYESNTRPTADEVVPYVVHFDPAGGNGKARPGIPRSLDAVLMDCDGRVANDLLVRRATLDENSPEGTLAHEVLEADALILVIDASAPPAQVEADFGEFARFLRTMERGRKRRSEVAGLPVFLVLTKCDLLAQPGDSPADWMDRIEQRKRDVDAHFRAFLARQEPAHKPEAQARKPEAPAKETLENADEPSSEVRRIESPFGSIDLHIWATAIKRPALAGSPAKPREPYGVAELFRQSLSEAADYRARVRRSNRRLFLLAGTVGTAVLGMVVLTAVLLTMSVRNSRASLLASRVEDLRVYSRGGPAERLRGGPAELRQRLARFEEVRDDPQFGVLPAEQRAFVEERADELKSYIDYLEKLLKERPLASEQTEQGLERRLKRLESDLALPRADWQGTRADEMRRGLVEATQGLLDAVRQARNWYAGASETTTRLWSFADYRVAEDAAGIDWADWTARVQKVLDPAYRPPFADADPIPGASSLTWAVALRFDRVVEARLAWEGDRKRLAGLLDVTSALGLATASKERPALLVFPRGFTLAQTKTRQDEFREAYPEQAKSFTVDALPEAIIPKVRQVAGNQYRALLEPGRGEVLRQMRLAGRGTRETVLKWRAVRSWLREPAELTSWRFLAGVLLRLQKKAPEDPVQALGEFLGKKQFVIDPRSLVLELPETSELRPRAGARLVLMHPATGKQAPLAYETSGEPQLDRGRRLRLYTFRLARGDRIVFKPGDNLWAELPLSGGEQRLAWSQARSSLFLFERLRTTPRVQPVGAKSLDAGRPVTGAALVIRPDESVPHVPDLLPDVPEEERGNP
jgi:GTPase SAR1 family protein